MTDKITENFSPRVFTGDIYETLKNTIWAMLIDEQSRTFLRKLEGGDEDTVFKTALVLLADDNKFATADTAGLMLWWLAVEKQHYQAAAFMPWVCYVHAINVNLGGDNKSSRGAYVQTATKWIAHCQTQQKNNQHWQPTGHKYETVFVMEDSYGQEFKEAILGLPGKKSRLKSMDSINYLERNDYRHCQLLMPTISLLNLSTENRMNTCRRVGKERLIAEALIEDVMEKAESAKDTDVDDFFEEDDLSPVDDNTGPKVRVILEEKPSPISKKADAVKLILPCFEPVALHQSPITPSQVVDSIVARMPWCERAIEVIAEDMESSLMLGNEHMQFKPVLLIGEPGVGKSFFAYLLHELTEVPFYSLNVGGTRDSNLIGGVPRGWATASPCFPLMAIERSARANPMLLVDEIDKAAASQNGDTHSTLLQMLEETATGYVDPGTTFRCDISYVNWLLAGNSLKTIPAPLKSRLQIVHIRQPKKSEFSVLVNSLIASSTRKSGFHPEFVEPFSKSEFDTLFNAYEQCGHDVRTVKRLVDKMVMMSLKPPLLVN
jgi:hypothetical protein